MGTHTVASMVVLEGALPKRSDYRRFKIRTVDGPDDFASMAEVLGRRLANWERQQDISPHDPDYDSSFASLPNLVVIDGGKGQLSAGIDALAGFRERGVVVVSLAKRLEEVFLPGVDRPLVLAHDTAELQLLQRIRDEAHRFAITHHRERRDRAMTASVLDDLPGVGPARKRALIDHFGSADAVVAATADQLQAVPGLPAKIGRDLHSHLHRVCGRDHMAGREIADDADARPHLRDLMVITGFSGAGKSTAMNVFEDAGYFCVDNLPPRMIGGLIELFLHDGSKVAQRGRRLGRPRRRLLRVPPDRPRRTSTGPACATACSSSTPTSRP